MTYLKLTLLTFSMLFFMNPFFSQSSTANNNKKGKAEGKTLEEIFLNPPQDAKPRGYWLWPHGNFDYVSIKKELREFKDKGLGGVEIFDLGVADKLNVIPEGPGFMSPEQLDAIAYALQEAKKLDLEIGLIVSSSWNAGATWTPVDQGLMHLVMSADTVEGPVKYKNNLPFPELPKSFVKPYGEFPLKVPMDENGLPKFYKEVELILYPVDENGQVNSLDQIKILDQSKDKEFQIPEGKWVVMRTVYTNFGQYLWVPSDNSDGLTMDHYSKKATNFHFNTIIDKLEQRCGPIEKTALKRFYLASFESDVNTIWSPTIKDEFYRIHGYKMDKYLPALFGAVIKNKEITDRFLYDYRLTVSEMLIHNLYREARSMLKKHGLQICSESGGPGPPIHQIPTEDLKALGSVDILRGEFWNTNSWRNFGEDGTNNLQVIKSVASAAHTYNHKIVEMEAFTSFDKWQEGPATLKPFADLAFCEGMNRVVFHTMSHNLPEAGKPGWSFQAGTHINTNLTWWDLSYQMMDYFTRTGALLQEGVFVADAVFYCGHEVPYFTKSKHVRPDLGVGYDYDDINTEALLTAHVEDGRIVMPGGVNYAVLVLPKDDRMDIEILRKIDQLLEDGATIISQQKPGRVYGLSDYINKEKEMNTLSTKIWGKKNSSKFERKIGKGTIIAGKTARQVLLKKGIGPDVEFVNPPESDPVEFKHKRAGLDFIHRRTSHEEIYFVRNADKTEVVVDAKFRVTDKQPYLWDATTAEMKKCLIFSQSDGYIQLQLHLDEHGSIFVIFKDEKPAIHINKVVDGKIQVFPYTKKSPKCTVEARGGGSGVSFSASKAGTYSVTLSTGAEKNITVNTGSQLAINGKWDVRFPFGQGATNLQEFDSLYSWTDSKEEGTKYFSGTATYRKTIEVSPDFLAKNNAFVLDLGKVGEVAKVFLNGNDVGITGFQPYKLDISGLLREGENYLVVKVANTWLNKLISDHKLPVEKRITHTNIVNGPTQDLVWKDAKPLPSGLIGPVVISAKKYETIK